MECELIKKIVCELKKKTTPKRYNHTIGVVDAAVYLAQKYGESTYDAKIAALLHDFAKDFTREQLMDYIRKNDLKVDEIMLRTHELLHGKVASHIAENDFGIKNKNILNAIENHTTGRKNMSKLEKIIYLADFIELGRNYPGVDTLRQIAEEDLDKAILKAFNNTIVYVISLDELLHPNTLYARNEILEKLQNT